MKHSIAIKEKIIITFMKILICGAFSASLYGIWVVKYNPFLPTPFFRMGNYMMAAVFLVTYFGFAKLYGGFSIGSTTRVDVMYSQVIATGFLIAVCYVLFSLLSYRLLNVGPFFALFFLFSGFAVLWGFVTDGLYYLVHAPKKSLFIYNNYESYLSLRGIRRMKRRFIVEETVNSAEISLETLYEKMKKYDAVFLCGVPSDYRNEVVKKCMATGKVAYVKPKISDAILRGGRTIQLLNVPVYRCKRSNTSLAYSALKRAFDIVFSLFCIVISSPIMLGTAIAIKKNDGEKVFYRQERLTINGQVFKVIKFRSMKPDAEKDGVARLAGEHDDRITSVGKNIRKLRIDELPQLFNVLSGSMSIVGPRPERPSIAMQYEKDMPEFALRLQVKAGLTGYAQIYGKYNTPPYDKVLMDLMYVANQSAVEDLRLVVMTLKTVFTPSSTEGIGDGQTTAARNLNDDI